MLNQLKTRWAVFAVGMLLGMLVLVACGAATQTITPDAAETEEEPTTTGGGAETTEPGTEEAAPTGPAETEPAQGTDPGAGTLAEVIERDALKCGIHGTLPGFGTVDAEGNNAGFDVDYCRAVAAAVLGDAAKVEYVPLNADQRFPALQGSEIDVLIRNTTMTFGRDASLGLDFTVTTFYDGQGYVVRGDEFASVDELEGATICVTSGTTTEANLADDFESRGFAYTPQVFSETTESWGTFVSGACDAYTSDKSQLASLVSAAEDPAQYTILADTISKEPLGPVVRANDSQWRDIVAWVVYATIQAEELGINQENVDDFLTSEDINVQRLLGTGEDDLGSMLGLPKDFAYQVILQVGNYGDIYERNIIPLGITREGTVNALWTEGGLLYSPPWRP
jgi:general L-amino acid transport system substrate-binding protein